MTTTDVMCRLAKQRAPVTVEHDGRRMLATLVAWPGDRMAVRGSRQLAKVRLRNGAWLSVPVDRVHVASENVR